MSDQTPALSARQQYALKHAELLKMEILQHQRYLYNSTLTNIVGVPLLLSISRQFDTSLFVILLPVVVTFLMYLPVYYQSSIIRCARYLKHEVEPFLTNYQIQGYENFLELDGFGRAPERYFRVMIFLAFTLYYLFSLFLSAYAALNSGWSPQDSFTQLVSFSWTLYYGFSFTFFFGSLIYLISVWPAGSTTKDEQESD